ncbi:FadR/GntR family transcriptional regulator [Plantactinospora sp. DSM 117369]
MTTGRIPLYRRIQEDLRRYIDEHGLRPGDALPSEAELASAFSVSRLSLREAIKSLESVGVLHARHGGGVYVAEFSFAPILENLPYGFQLSERNLRELLELRESLEEGLMPKVRQAIRPSDLRELDALAQSMQQAEAEPIAAELDRQFHRRLFEPLDNRLVLQMIDLFWEVFHRMRHGLDRTPPAADARAARHQAIVDALRTGDDASAAAAMSDHFADLRDWLARRDAERLLTGARERLASNARPSTSDAGTPTAVPSGDDT